MGRSIAIRVRRAARLRGNPALPGDKSISHRALLLALLAVGESRITAAGDGEDVRSTAAIVAALGARVERVAESAGRVDYRVVSPGGDALTEPDGILDCGNSGTTTRLLAGLLAGRPMFAVLDGDASLRPPSDGPCRGAAALDGGHVRRPARRNAAAAGHHRAGATVAHRLRDARSQCAGQVRDPAGRARRGR